MKTKTESAIRILLATAGRMPRHQIDEIARVLLTGRRSTAGMERIVRNAEATSRLGVTRTTIRHLYGDGILPPVRYTGRVIVGTTHSCLWKLVNGTPPPSYDFPQIDETTERTIRALLEADPTVPPAHTALALRLLAPARNPPPPDAEAVTYADVARLAGFTRHDAYRAARFGSLERIRTKSGPANAGLVTRRSAEGFIAELAAGTGLRKEGL